jgi:hypothetical protein
VFTVRAAGDVLSSVRRLIETAREPLAAIRHGASRLETDFGATGCVFIEVPQEISSKAENLLAHGNELPDYLDLREQQTDLENRGLYAFLKRADELALDYRRIPEVFKYLVTQRRAERARRTSPPLARAAGATLDARRRAFAEHDRDKIENDRALIRANLLERRPELGSNIGRKTTWTEMALLNNEFQKERRFIPVRALLERARNSIRELKPCFMMSPLSLGKFLPREGTSFDLVVIDEASQMKPEDALGGLLRAKQIVVVGDPKQLPPTDFFNRPAEIVPEDDEEFEDIDDESILEACQKTFRI